MKKIMILIFFMVLNNQKMMESFGEKETDHGASLKKIVTNISDYNKKEKFNLKDAVELQTNLLAILSKQDSSVFKLKNKLFEVTADLSDLDSTKKTLSKKNLKDLRFVFHPDKYNALLKKHSVINLQEEEQINKFLKTTSQNLETYVPKKLDNNFLALSFIQTRGKEYQQKNKLFEKEKFNQNHFIKILKSSYNYIFTLPHSDEKINLLKIELWNFFNKLNSYVKKSFESILTDAELKQKLNICILENNTENAERISKLKEKKKLVEDFLDDMQIWTTGMTPQEKNESINIDNSDSWLNYKLPKEFLKKFHIDINKDYNNNYLLLKNKIMKIKKDIESELLLIDEKINFQAMELNEGNILNLNFSALENFLTTGNKVNQIWEKEKRLELIKEFNTISNQLALLFPPVFETQLTSIYEMVLLFSPFIQGGPDFWYEDQKLSVKKKAENDNAENDESLENQEVLYSKICLKLVESLANAIENGFEDSGDYDDEGGRWSKNAVGSQTNMESRAVFLRKNKELIEENYKKLLIEKIINNEKKIENNQQKSLEYKEK